MERQIDICHLALQFSDRASEKQAGVISGTDNVLKIFGPDKITLKIVIFGPGIDLLHTESSNRAG